MRREGNTTVPLLPCFPVDVVFRSSFGVWKVVLESRPVTRVPKPILVPESRNSAVSKAGMPSSAGKSFLVHEKNAKSSVNRGIG